MSDRQGFTMTAVIRGREIRIRNRATFNDRIARLKDGDYTITIEKAHATRSLDQNALYWAGYVTPLAEHTGNSPLDMHDYLKQRFLGKPIFICDKDGVIVDEKVIPGSTTRLDKVQFSDYLRSVEVFSVEELGFIVKKLAA